MAKRLFMITKNFPYGSGESFIESEIQVAAKKFEEIIILVYRANLKEKERIVPKNVKVIPLCDWSKYKKICFPNPISSLISSSVPDPYFSVGVPNRVQKTAIAKSELFTI